MGFELNTKTVNNQETGEDNQIESGSLTAIYSTDEAVTIPDSIKIGEKVYPVSQIDGNPFLQYGFNYIKKLTIPASISSVILNYSFDKYLDAIYMLGTAPNSTSTFSVPKIYVCNRSCFETYLNNDIFSNSLISPYGWDFEWITVNVEKNGEFAETYLTQNDYNWGAAQNVKVVGNINYIDLRAIRNLTYLRRLDLSETAITSIPAQFMNERTSLVEVKLPSTLKKIEQSAFSRCSALQSVDLNGITTIDSWAFSGCKSLTDINLTGAQSIGRYAFRSCSRLNNIDLSTVVHIGANAFEDCDSLSSVDLTSAVTIGSIPEESSYSTGETFKNCTSLREVKFGNNLQTIHQCSFQNSAIENATLPNSLTVVSNSVFENCKNLIYVEFPSTLTSIQAEAFQGCSSISSVSINSGLLSIGDYAFLGCTSLENVTLPSTVKYIGDQAFSYTGIKNFKCYAAVPPTTGIDPFYNNDMDRTYLYVPPFSKDFYRNTFYWSNFYLMRSIEDKIDYILVDRPLTINLEEEDNAVVANNPTIELQYGDTYQDNNYNTQYYIGQLTATGEGTLSAGQFTVSGQLSRRTQNRYQYIPTLINYADKMRADSVKHVLEFYNYDGRGEWHFISLPYDVKVSDIIPSNDTYWVIRRYDSAARAAGETSSTWVNLTNDDIMEAGKGYIVSVTGGDKTLTFKSGNSLTKNNLFRSTDVIVPLTEYEAEFAHNRSWNLIGNPYPCYFDMHYLNEDFTAPITVWNGSSYVAYSPVDDDLVLSPYEAFFVQCPLDATEMTFKEGGRMHSDEGKSLYKSSAKRSINSVMDRNVFNFEINNDNISDRARIVMNNNATMDYEVGRDASKFFAGNSNCAQIYVADNVNYSISERPISDGMATLGIRSSKEDVYRLSLSGNYSSEWNVIVTDILTGIKVDLTNEDYQFTAVNGDSNKRFSVKFQLGENTDIESVISDFGKETNVTVNTITSVTVYTGCISKINVPSSGIYVISNGTETRKVILK